MASKFSAERRAQLDSGVELCFQTLGAESDPPLLMIMGLGTQLVHWPDGLCERLAAGGLRPIRFDNRDAGRSSWLADGGRPSLRRTLAEGGRPPYTLSDMAADCTGLLDVLGIEAAHVFGASLGGMVAQTLAIEHPERVLSLASLMSHTGDMVNGRTHEVAMPVLLTRPPAARAAYVENVVAVRRVIGSPGFETDEDWVREVAGRAHDRGLNPAGTQRQLAAILGSGDRTPGLRGLDIPTVVIHGTDDVLIDVSGGEATAAAIPGSELVLIDGLGHDLPPGAWPAIADAVLANVERANRARPEGAPSASSS